jgi:MFS family permease
MNLPVTLAAYAKSVFHSGPGGYALMSALVAVGSLSGALISTRLRRPGLRRLIHLAGALAVLDMLAAALPGRTGYLAVLSCVGAATLLLFTSANSTVQLAAHDRIRGRVMGVYLLVFIGSGAIGGPIVGSIDEHLGPRVGMFLAGLIPAAATVLIGAKLALDARARVQSQVGAQARRLVKLVPALAEGASGSRPRFGEHDGPGQVAGPVRVEAACLGAADRE